MATLKSRVVLGMMAFAIGIGLHPILAHAAHIAIGDTTLFFDNYETASEVSLTKSPDPTIDADPDNPAVGTWSEVFETTVAVVQVTSSTTSPDPGPYSGNQYLRLDRYGAVQGRVTASFAQQDSGVVHTEFMMYLNQAPAGTTYHSGIKLGGSGVERVYFVYMPGDGDLKQKNAAGAWVSLGLYPTINTWQLWEVAVDLGDQTFDVAIDGATAAASVGLPLKGEVDTLDYFYVTVLAAGNRCYIDTVAVPEPATIVLLLSGLVLLAIGCRRHSSLC